MDAAVPVEHGVAQTVGRERDVARDVKAEIRRDLTAKRAARRATELVDTAEPVEHEIAHTVPRDGQAASEAARKSRRTEVRRTIVGSHGAVRRECVETTVRVRGHLSTGRRDREAGVVGGRGPHPASHHTLEGRVPGLPRTVEAFETEVLPSVPKIRTGVTEPEPDHRSGERTEGGVPTEEVVAHPLRLLRLGQRLRVRSTRGTHLGSPHLLVGVAVRDHDVVEHLGLGERIPRVRLERVRRERIGVVADCVEVSVRAACIQTAQPGLR